MNNQEKEIILKFEKQLKDIDKEIKLPDSLKSENLLCLIEDVIPNPPIKKQYQNNLIIFTKKFALPIAVMVALAIIFPYMQIEKSDSSALESIQDRTIAVESGEACQETEIESDNEEKNEESSNIKLTDKAPPSNMISMQSPSNFITVKNEDELKKIIENAQTSSLTKSINPKQSNNNATEEYVINSIEYSSTGFEIINIKPEAESDYNEKQIEYDILLTKDETTGFGFFDDCMIDVIKDGKIVTYKNLPYLVRLISFTNTDDYITVMYESRTKQGNAICIEVFNDKLESVFSFAQSGENCKITNLENGNFSVNSEYIIPKDQDGFVNEEMLIPHIYDMKTESIPVPLKNIKINPEISQFKYTIKSDIAFENGKFKVQTTAILN